MPREYPASKQPPDLVHAESAWMQAGMKGHVHEQFYYEVRETTEFTIEDILEPLAFIYKVWPEDFVFEDNEISSGPILENIELFLKPEISMKLFGHQVSFEFTVEGRLTKQIQNRTTNLSRIDYDENMVPYWQEILADYIRHTKDGDGGWKIQPDILAVNQPPH